MYRSSHLRHLLATVLCALLVACASPEERAANYLANAQKLFDEGDYVKARLEAQNAAQIEPKNAKARFLLARVAEEQKEYQQMFGHLLVVVDEDPDNVDARLKLGTLYFLGQAWDDAREQVDALLKLAPNDARVRLLHARTMIQAGDQEGGIREIEAAMKIEPDSVEGLLLQSSAYAVKDVEKGIANIDAALTRIPSEKARPLRELRIILLSQAKRTGEVEADLTALARDFPKEDQYQFELAKFYTAQGRVEEAKRLLKAVAEVDPTDVQRRLGYVQFLASQKDMEQAEAALQTFVQETPENTQMRLALAQLYEQNAKVPQARETYEAIAEFAPKSADGLVARNRLAALDVRDGKVEDARKRIAGILEDVPDNAEALLLRAVLKVVDKDNDGAVADLRLVLRKDEKNEKALLLLAQAYASQKELVLAKDTYRRLLSVNPESGEALEGLAVLEAAAKNYPEAEELLRQRLAKKPDDLLASGRLVEILMAQGLTAKAEEEARRMANLKSQTGVGDFQLARVLLAKKDLAGAEEAFRRSASVRTADPLPFEGLVRTLLAQGKSKEAISLLEGQLDDKQNQLFARYLLAGIYGNQGDRATAERYLEEVIKAKPDAAMAYISLAGLSKDDPQGRIRAYRRGLDAVPDNPEMGMLLATELEAGGDVDGAIGVYERLYKANPEYLPAANNLAALLLDHRQDKPSHARALEIAKKLADADNPGMQDTLGWAWYRNGDYARSIGVLERVVAKAGEVPVFRYHLGMAYLASGNTVGARQELTAAVRDPAAAYPGRAEAEAALRKLGS